MTAHGKAKLDSGHSMVSENPSARLSGTIVIRQCFRAVLVTTRPRNTVWAANFPELRSACVGAMCFPTGGNAPFLGIGVCGVSSENLPFEHITLAMPALVCDQWTSNLKRRG